MAGSAEAAIEARGLRKSFGEREALRGVDFAAAPGEMLAVIGPNGAGKTTLLSILAGIQAPDDGVVTRPPGEVGWVPQQPALYSRLSVAENLRLFARLERVADPEDAVARMLEQTGLRERAGDQVGTLSGGNQQRVNIAIGMLGDPGVLLLDEPTGGLDPGHREELWRLISGLAEAGRTIVFTTHNVAEAERFGQRLLVIAGGERIFHGTVAELHAAEAQGSAGTGSGTASERDFERAFIDFLAARGHR